jgi:hypothetical protein
MMLCWYGGSVLRLMWQEWLPPPNFKDHCLVWDVWLQQLLRRVSSSIVIRHLQVVWTVAQCYWQCA